MANAGGGYRPAVYRPQPPYPRGDGQAPASLLPRGVLCATAQGTTTAVPRVTSRLVAAVSALVGTLSAFRTFFVTLATTQSLSAAKQQMYKTIAANLVSLQAR